jgi:hypothetical protein
LPGIGALKEYVNNELVKNHLTVGCVEKEYLKGVYAESGYYSGF